MSTPLASALGADCPHCGQVHTKCLGHRESKVDGHVFPCGRFNSDGHPQCFTHGGPKTPKSRQRARRVAIKPRQRAMTETIKALNALGVPIETDPLDALTGQLAESAGIVAVLREHLQRLRIPDVTDPKDGLGGTDALWVPTFGGGMVPHVLLGMYNDERERFGKLADLALRAGVAERQVRIMEQQASLFAELLRKVLDDPELNLSPAQRQTGRRIAATQLRLVGSS
jgi:hypothetical protein